MAQALVKIQAQAKRGEAVEVRALIQHPMETGFRRDDMGKPIARDIIREFVCTYAGEEVLRAELQPAIAANPFLVFHVLATESGEVAFRWTDDKGVVQSESARLTVS
ncbi:MAG: thiosulfate oxidation carrier complex protein SoxZ [Alphaproteobacteria bacterium]|nr:thiosulfate oxidation carrier complex protein SoxZ [Alphaproteobacteria bacterium]